MHMFLVAAAACLTATSPAALLDANRTAMSSPPATSGTATLEWTYKGQGLVGRTRSTFDLMTGYYIDEAAIGPTKEANGFDGRLAWMRDLSGAYVPQASKAKRALAISQSYRNANIWWRAERGGARIEQVDCDGLRVTPPEGNAFEAWFDPKTHLLARVREIESFGTTIETRYANYQRRTGRLVATRIETLTNDTASSLETALLSGLTVSRQRPATAYALPATAAANGSLPSAGRVTVPFQLLNNHVIVDVQVNGRGPFPFLVDTGGHDIVTPATLHALSISSAGDSPSGGGGEKMTTSGYAHVDLLNAGGAVLRDQVVLALDFSPPDVEGLQLGGMLGLEFLERFVVRIDYGLQTMTMIDPGRFTMEERADSGIAIPFTFYEHMPQVEGVFDGRPARFNIDTGSRSDVTLTRPFVEQNELRRSYPDGITATESWGVGGPTRPYVARAASVTLGSVVVPKPIAGLSESKRGAFSDANYDGNIGSGILKRYAVTFDYSHQVMYLEPVKQPDADTGQFDRTGMWLNLAADGLEIKDVTPGSPAVEAGLRIGDIVIAIDGKPVKTDSLSNFRRMLKLAPVGQPLTIAYRRANATGSAILVPRKLIPD